MRPPALQPNTIRHNPFTTRVTICFIASVWIREKYDNFILSSYWKRGKYKILYFLYTTPSDTTNSPQQLSPATICFIASVWIREKYENFILSSYWKRGKYKILYFSRFQYEESMSFFKMSGSISIFKQVYQCSKSIPSTSIFLRSI